MRRVFLAEGDRAGSAVITEGLSMVTCANPPPEVRIATLGMKTYCMACKREGHISPVGPRLPGTAPNGQGWALSGDINICGCNPPPVFEAERGMYMDCGSGHATTGSGQSRRPLSWSIIGRSAHDEQYVLRDASQQPLARVRYRIRTESGQEFSGVTDAMGRTQRVTTTGAEDLQLHIHQDHV